MKYSGQVLAFVLVLLLIGTVVGFALYARSVREAERLVSERAASEANELVETVIGVIGTADFDDITSDNVLSELEDSSSSPCSESELASSSGCRRSDMNMYEMEDLISRMVAYEVDLRSFDRDLEDFCKGELMLRYGMQDDEIILEKDEVYGMFFDDVDNWGSGGCRIDYHMDPSNYDVPDGFIMSTFYKDDSSYKSYSHSDIEGFLYSGIGSSGKGGDWSSYNYSTDYLSFPSDYPGVIGSSSLYEVRFTSIGGRSILTWEMSNCDLDDLYLVVEVGGTCHDRYVGKRFNVPSEPYAPRIFDYVLFNNEGELRPERIQY